MHWIGVFLIAATALVWAGITLARAGDEIATRTGLGGLLVGMLLVAAATSLPEIVTDVSASIAGAPDLAVGDLFGSNRRSPLRAGGRGRARARERPVRGHLGQGGADTSGLGQTFVGVALLAAATSLQGRRARRSRFLRLACRGDTRANMSVVPRDQTG
jgi:hypothetical protein